MRGQMSESAVIVLVFTLVILGPRSPETSAQETGVVFEGARLIAGDGNAPIEDSVFLVRDGRIEQMGPRRTVKWPAGTPRVDLTGKTVMPMLVNLHGHVGYWKDGTVAPANYSRENVLDHLRRFEYYGVGAVLSLGTDRNDVELHIRDEQLAGTLKGGALLFSASDGLVAPNPGSTNGGPGFAADVVREAGSEQEARRHVRELAAKKVDIIKIWVDDRNGTKPKLTPPVYRAAIDEAHKQGLRAIAHVYYLDDAKDLVRGGINGFAHLVRAEPGVDDELVRLMNEHDVFACSTMNAQRASLNLSWLDDPALAETVGPAIRAALKAQLEKQNASGGSDARLRVYTGLERSIKKLSDGNVRIGLCGDTGLQTTFPGFNEHRELEAMVDAGVPPLQVIRAATQTSAAILGLSDLGTLAPGKRADFIVLDANPLERMANTRKIAAVYRGGQALNRQALRTAWTNGATRP